MKQAVEPAAGEGAGAVAAGPAGAQAADRADAASAQAADAAAAAAAADEFERLFRAVYLGLHRRDDKRSTLSGSSRAVLTHLSFTGPLTIGELAGHLDRAQSVVSDIVSQLEAKGLLERRADDSDRRRTLVWLTSAGLERLRLEQAVLSQPRLADALQHLPAAERAALLTSLRHLVEAVEPVAAVPLLAPPPHLTPHPHPHTEGTPS